MDIELSKKILFYCYRYFIVHNGQQNLYYTEKPNKRIITGLIEECIKQKNITSDVNGSTYILLHMMQFSNNINLFKFCRDSQITKYQLDEQHADIVEIKESNYPFIYVVIDSERQIVLLENKTTVFRNISYAKNIFTTFLENYIHDVNYTISLDEISNSMTFWDAVSDASDIYEVDLNLKSPNLFNGRFSTNELLRELKTSLNNDEVDLRFRNKQGQLKVERNYLDDPIKYAGAGGGTWKVKYRRKNTLTKRTLTSSNVVKSIEINDFEEEYNLFPENIVIEEIRHIDEAFGGGR